MALFEGLNPDKRYTLISKLSQTPIFEFKVRTTAPSKLFLLGDKNEGKSIFIDEHTPFIPSRFKVIETGNAPERLSFKTAGYRAQTAAERIEQMIRQREESERLKAMGPANEAEGLVPDPEEPVDEDVTSNAVFWGVVAYPKALRKIIVDSIYLVFFLEQHTAKRNSAANFNDKFSARKFRLIQKLRKKGINPSLIDFTAPWLDFKNYDKIANRYSEARAEFSSGGGGGGGSAAAAPPDENDLSSGSSLENVIYGGTRKRSNGRRQNRLRKTRRRR